MAVTPRERDQRLNELDDIGIRFGNPKAEPITDHIHLVERKTNGDSNS